MPPRVLAFRPASVVERLGRRSAACPLSLRDLLGPALELGLALPVVRAPVAGVARGALVAAQELRSAIGLALPPGVPPERWFDAVAEAADELAAGLPIVLSAEVRVEGEGATQVERAYRDAWRLVEAGLTHVAVDVADVAAGERGRVLADVVAPVTERGIALDVVLPLEAGKDAARRAVALVQDLADRGVPADLASVRCAEPLDADDARAQVATLARLCAALSGLPVMRRGPVSAALLPLLRGSPLKACDDGGTVSARAIGLIPLDLVVPDEERGADRLEAAAAELSDEGAERLEARAYLDAVGFLEALGGPGSAPALAGALASRLEGRPAP